jgi:UDP-N-acetylglucosamine acyltransferase
MKIASVIHQTAVVEPGAKIAQNVTIGPYSIIYADVEIGEGTVIGPHVVLYNGVKIGRNCRISAGTTISSNPTELEFWEHPLPNGVPHHVVLGDNVHIEPNVTIHGEIRMGNKVWIGSNVTIHHGARIGHNCKIFPGAVISAIPQDLKFKGEETTLIIGDNTIIRECATLNRGTEYNNCTVIGSDCLIMAYVHVAHDCIIGNHVIISNAVNMGGHVEIGDYATIGGTAAIHQFVKIGCNAMIQGGALVTKDVPPFVIAAREPIQYEGVNLVGVRRRGYSNEQIRQMQDTYKILFCNGLNYTNALEEIEREIPDSPEKNTIVLFCKAATRGLIKGIKSSPKMA